MKTWTATIDGKEYEVRPATPAYDGDTGLFHLSSAYTLPKGKVSFSLFRDNFDRDPKDIDFSIHGLSLGYGATDKLELFGQLRPPEPGQRRRAVPGRASSTTIPFAGTIHDALADGLRRRQARGQSTSSSTTTGATGGPGPARARQVPTADEAEGPGHRQGVLRRRPDPVQEPEPQGRPARLDRLRVQRRPRRPSNIGNAFKWGVGLNVPACQDLPAPGRGDRHAATAAPTSTRRTPSTSIVGPVFWIKPGFFIRPAISWALNFDDRGLGSGIVEQDRPADLDRLPPRHAAAARSTPRRRRRRRRPTGRPTVTCDCEKSTSCRARPRSAAPRRSDPDGDPLTYAWSASAGRVTGSGADANFDSDGRRARRRRHRDGHASPTAAAARPTPPPRLREGPGAASPRRVTCTSGGFPRNLARLNNVDKACLDDVASRLRQDPRSRVVVVGHADSSERYPEVIARKRAEAIKDYLVKERGVDEARITAKQRRRQPSRWTPARRPRPAPRTGASR